MDIRQFIISHPQWLTPLIAILLPLLLIAIGWGVGRLLHHARRGIIVAACLSAIILTGWLYGVYVGFRQFEVRRVELAFADLPPAFDGYTIVQFGDAHVGTYSGWRKEILQRAVDSINAQHADMVVFTGDMQNRMPCEMAPHYKLLSAIDAPDGVFSVLGNHDYAMYLQVSGSQAEDSLEKTCWMERQFGWKVLNNQNRMIRRGTDSIFIAGMENDGEGRFPAYGNIQSALWHVPTTSFVVLLEHDPTSWRRKILKNCHAQLTLSGHTHGGQLQLFGWSPAAWRYKEYDGLYQMGDRQLFVTRGLGGVIPFRFGVSGEIVVITLRKK